MKSAKKPLSSTKNPFHWKHYEGEIILLNVRWYCSYGLSYRDLVEMMEERGLNLAHTTIMRWVHQYAPEIDKKIRPHLKRTGKSWRVDETYIKVKGKWTYLYRAVDKEGNTLDFILRAKRDAKAASRFFKKTLKANHTQTPRVINVDKNPTLSCAIGNLKVDGSLPSKTVLRQVKFLNNIVEQDHRFIKKITKPALGFKSCRTASKTLCGIEAMHMIRKGQVKRAAIGDETRAQFINKLFGLAS
jgi:IS6 family transposase